MCPDPEDIFVDLLQHKATQLLSSNDGNDMLLDIEIEGLDIKKLTRFVFILGHVAMQQMKYIETLFNEAKKKSSNDQGENTAEEMILECNSFENELEEIKETLEKEAIDKYSIFGIYAPIISQYCYDIEILKTMPLSFVSTVTLTLAKFCTLEKQYCKDNVKLILKMINEKNLYLSTRKNLVISLGDLILRFPNILDAYTPNIFGILNSNEVELKKTCLLVLEHLTLNDMIKARGNISKIAMLLIDEDLTLRSLAKRYMSYLCSKMEFNGNMLYNSIPDILSHLLEEKNLTERDFEKIMHKILDYTMT